MKPKDHDISMYEGESEWKRESKKDTEPAKAHQIHRIWNYERSLCGMLSVQLRVP